MTDSAGEHTLLLKHGNFVLADRVSGHAHLLIENGRISRVLDSAASEEIKADSIIDLAGLTVFPGFIDIHIHGAVGVDTMAATVDDLGRVAEFLAGQGITAWLPTLVPGSIAQYEQAIRIIEKAMTRTLVGLEPGASGHKPKSKPIARVLGVHYEGPFVNSEQCGALHREHFRTFKNVEDLEQLPTISNPEAIHFMTLAPEIEGGIELVTELRRRQWVVSIGHTRATPDILDQASTAGANHMTHFMNAMAPLHHRAPGPVGWGLVRDDVTVDIIADGVHLDHLMLKVLLRCKTAARVSLISDAIAAAGMGDGKYEIWGETIAVNNGRTQNANGSIAGSVITMLDAVRTIRSIGIGEVETATMASLNPARLIGIDQDCGSIEVGKRADLVALDDQSEVRLSLINGLVAFDSLN